MQLFVRFVADWLIIPVVLIALYALVWCVPNRVRYARYCYILMAGATAYTLAKVAGLLWQPEQLRPFELIGAEPGAAYLNNPGFPSDHALFTMFLALAVWYGTRNRRLGITLVVLAAIISVGRVAALVHTPLDVAGGVIIACVGSLWYGVDKIINKSSKIRKNVVK